MSADIVSLYKSDVSERKDMEPALRESEARYRAIVQDQTELICRFLADGTLTFVNDAYCRYFNKKRDELIGHTFIQLIPDDDREKMEKHIASLSLENPVGTIEHRAIVSSGEIRWQQWLDRAIFDDRACLIEFQSVGRDITESKRMELALRESEERYRAVFTQTYDGIYLCDINTKRILEVNPALCQLLDYTEAEIMELTLYDLVATNRENIERNIQRLLVEKHLLIGESHHRRKDGSSIDVEVSLNLISYGRKEAVCAVIRDITERKRAQDALRESEARLQAILDGCPSAIYLKDLEGRLITINHSSEKTIKRSKEKIIGKTVYDLFPQEIAEQFYANDRQVLSTGISKEFEEFIPQDDGLHTVIANKFLIYNSAGNPYAICGISTDISDRKRSEEALRQSEAMNSALLNAIPDLMIRMTKNGTYLDFRPAKNFKVVMPSWDIIGKNLFDILPANIAEQRMYYVDQALSTGETQIYEYQMPSDNSTISYQEARIVVSGEDEVLVIVRDISDRKQNEEIIRYQAFYDQLSGLPNRILFEERLSISLHQTHRNLDMDMVAVMFLDLDRFKTINDTLGHAMGDRLLQSVGQRLTGCLREGDTVARWGGDEFILLLPNISCTEDAAHLAQRILDAFQRPFNLEGHRLHITISIGIAFSPCDGKQAETLLRNADGALYLAKEQGRNNYQFYNSTLNSQASELLGLENDLYYAVKRGEFVVHYQPQVNTTTGEIIGMEALVRWQHPQFGLVSPAKFISLAEETGLIVPIGEWVLKTACAQCKAWQNTGLAGLIVAVNLSARQFQQRNLLEIVAHTLQETGLDPQCLELEITESIAMQNAENTRSIMNQLHQMGVRLSIDDFGTGYSSLGYLKKFPIDTLKIDKSFINDLNTNSKDAGIVNAIMILAKGLNIKVIAEGVETEAQKKCLQSLQCQEMQGYLFSRPLAAEDATRLMCKCGCLRMFNSYTGVIICTCDSGFNFLETA
ncbi:EAL and GGDEF domain-containing protein [Argonema antarcticum]|uniref:sensor domain-containing protein n=1 Tax=Argonema antarcticum TaxID=2942763 RepID=UPI00201169A6|nr:EAL domain-containing protein [Argonema antarcticum]MCL1469472.1 EAL domain-containing protein [Argonema antarcticum A004/B2]